MLSKHTFLPTKGLFMAAGIAACGLATVGQSANALNISFTDNAPFFTYDITVEANENITAGVTTVTFNNLDDVSLPSFSDATLNIFDVTSSGNNFIQLTAQSNLTFPASFNAGSLTFLSSTPVVTNAILWSTNATGVANTTFASIDGPAAVPFEFSPGLGLILSGTLFGALKFRSKFSQKEEINF
ncbi:MAG: hypothetical protein QNJ41_10420 [Xenococcaceae cyanobacterium MO_188.B32]|nr:hypothetical protein [Xenococcaceae cyanobacterium MO_188.B32]